MSGESGVCAMNIGPKERRKRFAAGIFFLVFSILMSFGLVNLKFPVPHRLFMFFPFTFAFLCILQARSKVCVVLALQGMRNMDAGEEKEGNSQMENAARKKAFTLAAQAAGLSALATAILILL